MSSLDVFKLDGRVALVTGGSKGLGYAMANALAGAGANVVIVSRHMNEAEEAVSAIAKETGREGLALEKDVTVRSQVEEMTQAALDRFGKIDILVNNAGINIRKPLLEFEDDEWNQVIDVNMNGPYLCSQIVGRHMVEQKYGRVINIASMLSFVTIPGRTAYSSTKSALVMFTKTLALEWASHGITVNAICPGPFETPLNRVLMNDPEAYKAFIAKIPLGRWGQPEELGGLAIFLASEASSYMTGASLVIDGGWTCQ
ncbi:MAG: glucose 1-dehydrogenase [Armatimonadetes bacterium]|nr:glucose 1-dehydrogenase [Armatimonadota bacterium]